MLKRFINRLIRDKSGSSLLEVLISIVILAMVVVPLGSSFVMAVRLNTQSRELMQQQLAVSNAVEVLMARGIDTDEKGNPVVDDTGLENVTVVVSRDDAILSLEDKPICYLVTVTYDGESLSTPYSLSTTVRASEEGGEGT